MRYSLAPRLSLAWLGLLPMADCATAQETAPLTKPAIRKLGTIDCDLVETTPVVFRDRLLRFESVRQRYAGNLLGKPYFRFVDVARDVPLEPFGEGLELGCAFVHDDEMFVFGVRGWGTDTIYMLRSNDLTNWQARPVLKQPGWKIFNTSVCRAGERFVMAFEVGAPPEVVGAAFTNRFAESDDLETWRLLDERHVFTKQRYSACPSLRFVDGMFYMTYLEARPGPEYETHLVRSRTLREWEASPLNPLLQHSVEDKQIANPRLTPAQRQRIAEALNRNNSDVDFCEYQGRLVIVYSWGNQKGNEFLATAEYDGTLRDLLRAMFPADR